MAFCGHWTPHRAPHGACSVLSGSESQVSGSAQLFHSLWSQASPLVHLFKHVRLVGLKDGHRVEGHACLTGCDVGLPDKGGSGPTWLGRKEEAGLPGRRQRGWKVGGQSVLYHKHGGVTLLHRTHKVGEVSGCRVSKAGGKRLFPGSGDILMQITEKWQLPPFRLGIWVAKEPLVEFWSPRLAGLVRPIQRELLSGARKHVHKLKVGRWRLPSWPLGGSASAKAGPKSSESEAAVCSISSSPKETVSRALRLGKR